MCMLPTVEIKTGAKNMHGEEKNVQRTHTHTHTLV